MTSDSSFLNTMVKLGLIKICHHNAYRFVAKIMVEGLSHLHTLKLKKGVSPYFFFQIVLVCFSARLANEIGLKTVAGKGRRAVKCACAFDKCQIQDGAVEW